jgi:hypothetical protein
MLAFRTVQQSNYCVGYLLFQASGRGRGWRAGEVLVDLAGDVALEAAQDVELGRAPTLIWDTGSEHVIGS